MTPRDLIMIGCGFLAGAVSTAAVGYFAIYKKYVPLRELENEVAELEEKRLAKGRQLDMMDKAYLERKEEYDKAIDEAAERLDDYQESLEELKSENDIPEPEVVDFDAIEYERTSKLNGRYVINDGSPRWDGPLTDVEQDEYDSCEGDEDLEFDLITRVKEARFTNSIDPKNLKYQITQHEADIRPAFMDVEDLDYYAGDDIIAMGRDLMSRPEDFIDMRCILKFGDESQTHDPNIVICRNDELKTDYVIERHEGSYQNAIFGIPEESIQPAEYRSNEIKAREAEEAARVKD